MYQDRLVTDAGRAQPLQSSATNEKDPRARSLLASAAAALGWGGDMIVDIDLFGLRPAFICAVDVAAHRHRDAMGAAVPMLDVDVLAMWEWPQSAGVSPPSPVALVGVVVPTDGPPWRRALREARDWSGFCASAILIPSAVREDESLRLECSYEGISLISASERDGVDVLQQGAIGRADAARRTTLDRWIEEKIYAELLSAGYLNQAGPAAVRQERGRAANG
jgi:hypothetical protein